VTYLWQSLIIIAIDEIKHPDEQIVLVVLLPSSSFAHRLSHCLNSGYAVATVSSRDNAQPFAIIV